MSSISSLSVTADYSSFDSGYGANPIGNPMEIIPFSYNTAIKQEGHGIDNQIGVLNATAQHATTFKNTVASSSRVAPEQALQEMHRQGHQVFTPQYGGNVVNAVRGIHYDAQSFRAMNTHIPKVTAAGHGATHYMSIYQSQFDNHAAHPHKVQAHKPY